MKKNIIIWDQKNNFKSENFNKNDLIIFWKKLSNLKLKNNYFNVIDEIEKNSYKYKKKYQDCINKIFKSKVNDNSLYKIFELNKNLNLADMSNLMQKDNVYKSKYIVEVLKLFAFEEIIKDLHLNSITLFSDNYYLEKTLLFFCKKNKIIFMRKGKNIFLLKNFYKATFSSKRILSIFSAFIWLLRESAYTILFQESINLNHLKMNNVFLNYLIPEDSDDIEKFFDKNFYWGNLPQKLIHHEIDSLWIHIFINSFSARKSKTYLAKLNKNTLQKHISLYTFLKKENFFKIAHLFCLKVLKIFTIKFNNLDFNSSFNLFYFFEKDLIEDLYGIGLIKKLTFVFLFKDLISNLENESKCFYTLENHSWEKIFNYLLKENSKSKSYGFIHNPIRDWDLRFLFNTNNNHKNLPDYFLEGDLITKQYLNQYYDFTNKIKNVESLRFLNVRKDIIAKKKCKPRKKYKLTIFTDFDNETSLFQLEILFSSNFFKKNLLDVLIKEHPAKRGTISKRIRDKKQISLTIDDPIKLIKESDIVYVSSGSSIVINLYYSNIPFLICCNPSLDYSILGNLNKGRIVNNSYEFDEFIHKTLNSDYLNEENLDIFNTEKNLNKWIKILKN